MLFLKVYLLPKSAMIAHLTYFLDCLETLFLSFSNFDLQDHGILRDGTKELNELQPEHYRRTLLQDLNRHAAVVLEGRTIGTEAERF